MILTQKLIKAERKHFITSSAYSSLVEWWRKCRQNYLFRPCQKLLSYVFAQCLDNFIWTTLKICDIIEVKYEIFLAIVCYLRTERYAKNSRTFSVSQSEYVQFSEFCLEGYKSEHGEGTNHPICNFSEIFAAVELLKKICLPSHLRKRVLMCSPNTPYKNTNSFSCRQFSLLSMFICLRSKI